MLFLGTHIQRDEHGRCTLLPSLTSSLQSADLQFSTDCILTRAPFRPLRPALISGGATREQRTRALAVRERGLCQVCIGAS